VELAQDWVAMAQEVAWVAAELVWVVMVDLALVGLLLCRAKSRHLLIISITLKRRQLRDSSTLLGMTNY
jgi:hypothetical protein